MHTHIKLFQSQHVCYVIYATCFVCCCGYNSCKEVKWNKSKNRFLHNHLSIQSKFLPLKPLQFLCRLFIIVLYLCLLKARYGYFVRVRVRMRRSSSIQANSQTSARVHAGILFKNNRSPGRRARITKWKLVFISSKFFINMS